MIDHLWNYLRCKLFGHRLTVFRVSDISKVYLTKNSPFNQWGSHGAFCGPCDVCGLQVEGSRDYVFPRRHERVKINSQIVSSVTLRTMAQEARDVYYRKMYFV